MNVIYILIPIAILFIAFGLTVFFWAVRKGQFVDLEKQGFSILFDNNTEVKTRHNTDNQRTENQNNIRQSNVNNSKSDTNNNNELSKP